MKKIVFLILISLVSCKKENDKLENLIGKDINSKEFQNYINTLDESPKISRHLDRYFYIFKDIGIDFSFTETDTIQAIFLYSEGADDRRQFNGQLPFGISFGDTRKIVERKIGPPDENNGNDIINFYSTWNDKNISISYKSKDSQDMNNKIHHISLIRK